MCHLASPAGVKIQFLREEEIACSVVEIVCSIAACYILGRQQRIVVHWIADWNYICQSIAINIDTAISLPHNLLNQLTDAEFALVHSYHA